jgi:hypothetical protein
MAEEDSDGGDVAVLAVVAPPAVLCARIHGRFERAANNSIIAACTPPYMSLPPEPPLLLLSPATELYAISTCLISDTRSMAPTPRFALELCGT